MRRAAEGVQRSNNIGFRLASCTKTQQGSLGKLLSRHLDSFPTLPMGNNLGLGIGKYRLTYVPVTDHCSVLFIVIDFGVWQSCCLTGRWKLKIQSHDGSIRKPKQIKTGAELRMGAVMPQYFSGIPELHKKTLDLIPPWCLSGDKWWLLWWALCVNISLFVNQRHGPPSWRGDPLLICKERHKSPCFLPHCQEYVLSRGQIIYFKWNRVIIFAIAPYILCGRERTSSASFSSGGQVMSEPVK